MDLLFDVFCSFFRGNLTEAISLGETDVTYKANNLYGIDKKYYMLWPLASREETGNTLCFPPANKESSLIFTFNLIASLFNVEITASGTVVTSWRGLTVLTGHLP